MTRALVLDFGGVVSRTLFETHALSERALGLAPGTLTWKGPFDPQGDALWRDMQAERISERDYWLQRSREVARLLGEDWLDMATLVRRSRGDDIEAVIRPEAVATIRAASGAGCRVAILSNELDLFYGAGFLDRLPWRDAIDVVVDATYTHILKPDPRAYALCAARLALPMESCVFVDDQQRNVEGARRAGMQVVHFDVARPADSYALARRLLGLPAETDSPSP